MKTLTTRAGTIYHAAGMLAWPAQDPDQTERGNYNPRLDWGPDAASACGLRAPPRL